MHVLLSVTFSMCLQQLDCGCITSIKMLQLASLISSIINAIHAFNTDFSELDFVSCYASIKQVTRPSATHVFLVFLSTHAIVMVRIQCITMDRIFMIIVMKLIAQMIEDPPAKRKDGEVANLLRTC